MEEGIRRAGRGGMMGRGQTGGRLERALGRGKRLYEMERRILEGNREGIKQGDVE